MRICLFFSIALSLIGVGPVANAFVVNVTNCSSLNPTTRPIYEFQFDQLTLTPDVQVMVTGSALNPDITMALSDDPNQANLFLVDEFANADISICKSKYGSPSATDITNVKVSAFLLTPDVTVRLTKNVFGADYVLFRQTEDFSDEEAAAYFAVLWMRVKSDPTELTTTTGYQLQYRRNGSWVDGPIFRGRWECSDAQWAPGLIGARCVEVQVPDQ